jgi:pimeloyl-ACP methyl ester carboxylesterase
MKPQRSMLGRLRRVPAILAVAIVCCGFWSCTPLAVVRTTEPHVPPLAAGEDDLVSARQQLAAAKRAQPLVALGHDLSAAKISLNILEQRPYDQMAQSIYNFSVARAVENVERAKVQPWRKSITVDLDGGNQYTLTTPEPADSDHDPSRYDLFPTDSLKISGKFFKTRPSINGVGAPLVAAARSEDPQFRKQYRLPRIYAPMTAAIQFSDRKARLEFIDPLGSEQVTVGKRVFPLSVDLSASTAMLIARERPERLGFSRVMDPEKFANTARLIQLQPFDPDRTPVILVHGLQETPASWAPMINALRNDPGIRKHYQFWFYSYPSGYPYPYSAALFRRELDGMKQMFPDHKRVILIGHSMGGMICRLMLTDAGDKIWRDFFSTSPAKTPLASDTRKVVEEALTFKHRPDVERVIFISTPHRGSTMASSWLGRFGAALLHTPRLFNPVYASVKPLLITNPAARPLNRMPNSVDTLEPNDRFVQSVNKLPMAPAIPYHSIMGDRGRGDTPNSSDGIVPYWSSHLAGAQSELIVPSGHGAQYNPEAIQEVARILKLDRARSND